MCCHSWEREGYEIGESMLFGRELFARFKCHDCGSIKRLPTIDLDDEQESWE
jgi:hypothetical protein